ncbi:hypothetical protein MIND_00359200 [Mycena indigotica]|uniref:Uncharacterized protein n=1 Tax=Mycena indigotica TaxID=2126181 RepID=A0A8H6WB61_9AGAR|nr:uncharacterized protein MIND_00359200 [Mycena indigotica]KAF7309871.1 hypothetical protein MIND_00359200 [Mycena indigotica]
MAKPVRRLLLLTPPLFMTPTLEQDIRALSNALCRVSATQPSWKHPETNPKTYAHIATLLSRSGMGADLVLEGVATHQHFSLFAFHPSLPSDSQIRITTRKCPPTLASDVEAILETGLQPTDFMTHCSQALAIVQAYPGLDIPVDTRDLRQDKCLSFFLQRSLGLVVQRFTRPKQLFPTDEAPWWKVLASWEPNSEKYFPRREFTLRSRTILILNALSPDLVSRTTVMDAQVASKCVVALVVLLDVINGNLRTCQTVEERTDHDWDKLRVTLSMLYSLLYETDIIRHIFYNTSLSAFLVSRAISRSKCDGPHLFRQLQAITACQRALLTVSGTKIIRAGVTIEFTLLSVPSPNPQMTTTPIMKLVQKVYPNCSFNAQADIRAHLGRLVLLEDPPLFSRHHNTMAMEIFMAVDTKQCCLEGGSDPRKLWALKEGMLQILHNRKSCCYACDLLATLLTYDPTTTVVSLISTVLTPWSPPPGTPKPLLATLRRELMAQLKHHLDCVIQSTPSSTTWSFEGRQIPRKLSPSQLSVLQVIETLKICEV